MNTILMALLAGLVVGTTAYYALATLMPFAPDMPSALRQGRVCRIAACLVALTAGLFHGGVL